MEATMSKEETAPRQKKGLFSRLRRSKKDKSKQTEEFEKREESPRPWAGKNSATTRDGVPVVTGSNPDGFLPSDVRQTVPGGPTITGSKSKKQSKMSSRRKPQKVVLTEPPSARESAFGGPPRYDWIDIETSAAVKVQSAYRRNKVMADLEKQGLSTQAMRNRARRRKARQHLAASEDTPDLFRCCGVGLIFGDATEEDAAAARAREKERYEQKKKEKFEREAKLRSSYRPPQKSSDELVECLEVAVEDVEQ